jgi:signal transduction histidine kinase
MKLLGLDLTGGFALGPPLRPVGYLLLAAYLALVVLVLLRRRPVQEAPASEAAGRPSRTLLVLLLLAAPLAALTLRLQLEAPSALAPPGQPLPPAGPTASVLGALPWMLAAGFLGEWQAGLVALAGGLTSGGWGTYQLLTPFQAVAQGVVVAWLMRRQYRDWTGRLARRPLISACLTGVVFGALKAAGDYAYSGGDTLVAMDYALSRLGPGILGSVIELGLGGLGAEAFRQAFPGQWFEPRALVAAPYSRSLASRLTSTLLVLGVSAGAILTYTNWLLARNSAREVVAEQMMQTASETAEGIPFFIQTGRANIRQLADELGESSGEMAKDLGDALHRLTYFSQLAVFDPSGALLAAAPEIASTDASLPLEVEAALASALQGIPLEVVTAPPTPGAGAQLVFLTPLGVPADEQEAGALVGWVDLSAAPLLQPVLARLAGHTAGEAYVADDRGVILIHPDPARRLARTAMAAGGTPAVLTQTAPDGTRQLSYALPVAGYSWHVVVTTPQRAVDALALRTTLRLLAALVSIGALAIVAAHFSARRLTRPLRQMAASAEAIAQGNLEHSVLRAGDDELGRLAASFERMRTSLRSRLRELDLLLGASQQMAASFELGKALPPMLSSLRELAQAEVARLVIERGGVRVPPEVYQAGEASPDWGRLDGQVLEICAQRGGFTLENPSRARAVLELGALAEPLEGISAAPLRNEDRFLGAIWLGYRRPHTFSRSETDLLSILATQVGIFLDNARLYQRAEGERNRLLAILDSTPDAVIAVDSTGRIALANPAAQGVLSRPALEAIGQPAEECIGPPELAESLLHPSGDHHTLEIKLDGGRVLYATATDVLNGLGQPLGRVMVLSDITHYKLLDSLKSEFVSTVSHDLRAPLTFMRGYATMLPMVGEVNEQQREFVDKILASVERMSKLVDDLLDLGRIETGIGLHLGTVSMEEMLQDVIAGFRPQAVNKQIALEVELAQGLAPVEADPMLMRQAVANLVDNAIKYTPAGGRVTLRAGQQDGRQLISVEDTGAGIAPADQPRLFEKFFRAHKEGEDGPRGSGLGLAIVKSIVEQHHGRVQVESRLGKGSKFTIAFPMRQVLAEAS